MAVFPAKHGHAVSPSDNNTRVIKDKVMELLVLFRTWIIIGLGSNKM